MTIRRARKPLPKRIAAEVTAALAALDVHRQDRQPLPEYVSAYLLRTLERVIGGEANLRNALDTSKMPRAKARTVAIKANRRPRKAASATSSSSARNLHPFIRSVLADVERPPEWNRLYGTRQALQFMRPTPGTLKALSEAGKAHVAGRPLSPRQHELLRTALLAVKANEADAWRAFSLPDPPPWRPASVRRAFMVLHAITLRRLLHCTSAEAADQVAALWGPDSDTVEVVVSANRIAFTRWLDAYISRHKRDATDTAELLAWIDAGLTDAARQTAPLFTVERPTLPENVWQLTLPVVLQKKRRT